MLPETIFLPHWIAGRYNAKEQLAIIFNNLKGETYLFEGPTALLWNELLEYDYGIPFDAERICEKLGCTMSDLSPFLADLLSQNILSDHDLSDMELSALKADINKGKSEFLKSSRGIGNFHESYESADNDYRNRVTGQGIPFAMSFELTYSCNEACIHCYNPNSPREGGVGTLKAVPVGEMNTEEYFPVLDSMKRMGVAKIIFTGGDPFMKKGLMQILRYAHRLKFAFSVYTNGQALYASPELYDELRQMYPQYIGLSLYSTVPEVHDGITRRPGSCEKTMAIARRCYEDAIGLQIKCPIMKANKETYCQVSDFAISVNGMPQFDVNITSSVDGDCYASTRLRLDEEEMKQVLKDTRIPLSIENSVGVIDRKPEMFFCGAGDSSFNIKPDGTLTPCCAFNFDCGNVRTSSFETIWNTSSALKKIRLLKYKDSDICGTKPYCRFCNRCIGQSHTEHGVPENHSEDNCFIAKIRYDLA